jgi:hypothetical protein
MTWEHNEVSHDVRGGGWTGFPTMILREFERGVHPARSEVEDLSAKERGGGKCFGEEAMMVT